jgi:hypothetical protein
MMRRKYKERLKNPRQRVYNYKYEEQLAFCIPFFRESTQSHDDYAEYLEVDTSDDIPTAVLLNESDYEETKDIKLNFRAREDDREYINETVLPELSHTDPLDVFLITIGSTLKKFSPYYLNQAKSKIFQVVQDFELQQIVDSDGQPSNVESNR